MRCMRMESVERQQRAAVGCCMRRPQHSVAAPTPLISTRRTHLGMAAQHLLSQLEVGHQGAGVRHGRHHGVKTCMRDESGGTRLGTGGLERREGAAWGGGLVRRLQTRRTPHAALTLGGVPPQHLVEPVQQLQGDDDAVDGYGQHVGHRQLLPAAVVQQVRSDRELDLGPEGQRRIAEGLVLAAGVRQRAVETGRDGVCGGVEEGLFVGVAAVQRPDGVADGGFGNGRGGVSRCCWGTGLWF
jgi:hypothetical protein